MAFDQSAFDVFQEGIIDPLEDLDKELQRLATRIVDEMRQNVPEDTGDLKKSIQLNMDRYGFQISMLDYGAYQNFGVEGSKGSNDTIPTDLDFAIGSYGVKQGTTFKFGTDNNGGRFGIKRQTFFSLTRIQDRLKTLIEQQIEE